MVEIKARLDKIRHKRNDHKSINTSKGTRTQDAYDARGVLVQSLKSQRVVLEDQGNTPMQNTQIKVSYEDYN